VVSHLPGKQLDDDICESGWNRAGSGKDGSALFMDDFVRFFPQIIQFLEEKYEIEIKASREAYPDC